MFPRSDANQRFPPVNFLPPGYDRKQCQTGKAQIEPG